MDHAPAAEGTSVTAFVAGAQVASTTVDADGNYVLEIAGSHVGATATFQVGGYPAAESITVTAGSNGQDLTVVTATQVVTPEARYYGTVTIDGNLAADGVVVIAWIGGMSIGIDIVENGQYLLVVDSDYTGSEIRFEVDGHAADQTVVFDSGFVKLDLTVSAVPRTPEHEFANLISAGILDSVFRYNDDKSWSGYSPAAPAIANDLAIIDSGDILWIKVTADGYEYASRALTTTPNPWNLVVAP